MGGYVALALGGRQPDAVRGVIVIDSAVPGLVRTSTPNREPTAAATPHHYATKDEAVRRFRVTPPDPYVLPYVAAHVAAESVVETEGGWTWKFDPNAQRRDRSVSNDLLSDLTGRLAILRAEHGLTTREIAARMVNVYGRAAPVIELAGTGHHVPLDDPIALATALSSVIATWTVSRTKS
jgi:pimeloyl-ACP methyl ester carboxylesterase